MSHHRLTIVLADYLVEFQLDGFRMTTADRHASQFNVKIHVSVSKFYYPHWELIGDTVKTELYED